MNTVPMIYIFEVLLIYFRQNYTFLEFLVFLPFSINFSIQLYAFVYQNNKIYHCNQLVHSLLYSGI